MGWLSWARFVARRPLAVAALGALVCLAGGLVAWQGLELKTARIELTGAELPFAQRFLALEEEFGDLNRIVITIQSPSRSQTRAYAAALATRIRQDERRFAGVLERVGPVELEGQALLLLAPERLVEGRALVERALPAWRRGALSGALTGWACLIEERLESGERSSGDAVLAERGAQLLEDLEQVSRGQEIAETPFDALPSWDEAGYVWGSEDRLLILVAFRESAGELDPRSASVGAARALVRELQPAWPEVEVGLTGKPVLEVDEMATYERDSLRSSAVALASVTLLLILALRRFSAPLLIGACLALSVAGTLGLATLWPGHLNLMAVVFVMVVIGLGVDFAIHLVGRYDEARARGLEATGALCEALGTTGPALSAGALTTAGAFCGAAFTDFKGLREFGVVAGFGVLASLLVSVSVVPALILLLDKRRSGTPKPAPAALAFRLLDRWSRAHPGRVLAFCAALTLVAGVGARGLRYQGNLLLLQDPELASVQLEHELLRDPVTTSWFLAYPARSLSELAAVASRVQGLPKVDRVASVLDLLPREGGQERLEQARELQASLRILLAQRPPPSQAPELRVACRRLIEVLERALDEALAGGVKEALPVLEGLLERSRRALAALPVGELPPSAQRYEERLWAALARRAQPLTAGELTLSPEALPPVLRDRFVGSRGSYLLRIYPKENLWDPERLSAFVAEVEGAAPGVTGVPAMLHGASGVMVAAYQRAGWIALGLVSLGLLVWFRRLRPAAVALLALAVGVVWTAGLMGWLGLDLNPANLIALPLMLGIGIDSAVHVVHRASLAAGPEGEALLGTSLGRALVYSGLTSVASFGTLALASHPGTASMGSAISLAILACVAAGVLVAPALWHLTETGGPS